ncbi:glycosyltransferase [Streptomyces sp. NPDC058268]|uniref:glycosyltransferase n=1 Tax=Streptomyces sp. NPDC058268 TaxID=3346413 RepID=UPI0036EAA6A5
MTPARTLPRATRSSLLARLLRPCGAAAARNAGTALASADTVVFLDGDMVIAPHVLADVAARGGPDTVLVAFRHNAPYKPALDGSAQVPPRSRCGSGRTNHPRPSALARSGPVPGAPAWPGRPGVGR